MKHVMPNLRETLRHLDDRAWRWIFGEADYMGLHPPLSLRLKIAARLPAQWIAPTSCKEPIFIVGCPRSGTTLLFGIFHRSSHLSSFRQESHWVWEFMHPPRNRSDHSQVLRAEDLTERSQRFIQACYGAAFGQNRFVDKCPTNSLRIGAIKHIFPDAKIVCLTRNGPDNVSSLIDTWTSTDRFAGFDVPEELNISGYGRQKWVHLLEPGWQEYAQRPIEEVGAHQWTTVNNMLQEEKETVDDRDWIEVRYEGLLEDPLSTISDLFDKLNLPLESEVADYVDALDDNVVNTSTQPDIGKWQWRNPDRVRRVMDMIRPVMEQLGYSPSFRKEIGMVESNTSGDLRGDKPGAASSN
ncbi:sulfotransferase family protein [Salinibacter ruber]|uniref:sulfotransferase family protein n=1 Tax=Salinibacter ruber TaxID=146919 RepID=UPI0020745FF7|nr:sulfotransferase [Salinibacter ruber]